MYVCTCKKQTGFKRRTDSGVNCGEDSGGEEDRSFVAVVPVLVLFSLILNSFASTFRDGR